MSTFNVPTREEVSESNQQIFDTLKGKLGFVPNLYATFALSENALANYLSFSGAKTSLKAKEIEVINLAVSNVNDCSYCQSAHTAIAKMNGFTDEQALELRAGHASFDSQIDALAKFARNLAENRGHASQDAIANLLNAGYTKENLVDAITAAGVKTIANYLHNATQIAVDFPEVPAVNATATV